MSMNYKPIVLSTGKIGKDKRKAREEAEATYRLSRLKLVPPDELNDRAKRHFEEIAQEAFWLDELSADLLAAYCVAYDRFLTLTAEMNKQSDTFIEGSKVISNPNRHALLEYANTLRGISVSLGLGNVDRLKLALKMEKEKTNKFDEFAI